jgi:hypothetical protein
MWIVYAVVGFVVFWLACTSSRRSSGCRGSRSPWQHNVYACPTRRPSARRSWPSHLDMPTVPPPGWVTPQGTLPGTRPGTCAASKAPSSNASSRGRGRGKPRAPLGKRAAALSPDPNATRRSRALARDTAESCRRLFGHSSAGRRGRSTQTRVAPVTAGCRPVRYEGPGLRYVPVSDDAANAQTLTLGI